MTSTFPEAFGMVAAEAAACGALPGGGRATRAWARSPARWPPPCPNPRARGSPSRSGPGAVGELADGLSGWLAAPEDLRAATREAIVAATRERYSWDGVARTVIAAARGELDDLPEP